MFADFGVNIIPRFVTAERVAVCGRRKGPVVFFSWEDPAPDYRGIASKLNLGSNDLEESENQ